MAKEMRWFHEEKLGMECLEWDGQKNPSYRRTYAEYVPYMCLKGTELVLGCYLANF